jgi:hypothetical protein
MTRKAAYFLLSGRYLGRPLDDGVVYSLLDAGYRVDIYTPADRNSPEYPAGVTLYPMEYRLSWLRRNLLSPRWREYDLFLGTSDTPMAVAGLLGMITRRKVITVCDEIYVGGYVGSARSYWKKLAQWGMRRSCFTIITDRCREGIQREYADLPADHRFIPYPCCFKEDRFRRDREEWRRQLGVPEGSLLLSMSGHTASSTGIHWGIRALDHLPEECRLLLQTGRLDEMMLSIFQRLCRDGRIIHLPGGNPSFIDAMSLNLAADIGLVFYLSSMPQFQKMGVSSNKLCMYLQMGIPVVVSRQESFAFVEEYGAGLMIDSGEELPAAVMTIAAAYDRFAANARRCHEEYVRPAEHGRDLTAALAALPRP